MSSIYAESEQLAGNIPRPFWISSEKQVKVSVETDAAVGYMKEVKDVWTLYAPYSTFSARLKESLRCIFTLKKQPEPSYVADVIVPQIFKQHRDDPIGSD